MLNIQIGWCKPLELIFRNFFIHSDDLFSVPILKNYAVNPLAPKDVYIRHIAQLTSRRCILNIYSTNILTECFNHAAHSPFSFLYKNPFIS